MPAYLVKLIGENELVGLFVCENKSLLNLMIDEFCDPSACEYKTVSHGSVCWMPGYGRFDFDEDYENFNGAELSESLYEKITDGKDWKYVDEKHPNPVGQYV